MGDRLARVLGVARQLQGLGPTEGDRGANLADLLTASALQRSLLGRGGLDGLRGGLSLANGCKDGGTIASALLFNVMHWQRILKRCPSLSCSLLGSLPSLLSGPSLVHAPHSKPPRLHTIQHSIHPRLLLILSFMLRSSAHLYTSGIIHSLDPVDPVIVPSSQRHSPVPLVAPLLPLDILTVPVDEMGDEHEQDQSAPRFTVLSQLLYAGRSLLLLLLHAQCTPLLRRLGHRPSPNSARARAFSRVAMCHLLDLNPRQRAHTHTAAAPHETFRSLRHT